LRICYVCHCSDAEVRFYKGVRGVCAEHWSAEMRMRRKDIAYRRPPRKFNEGFMFKVGRGGGALSFRQIGLQLSHARQLGVTSRFAQNCTLSFCGGCFRARTLWIS
jgi:hypothetical protein